MGATQFVPLEGRLIDEGVFLEDLNAELKKAQDYIVRFINEHGVRSLKATASVQAKIDLTVVNTDDQGIAVKCSMKSVLPPRPTTISMAVGGVGDDGKMACFVRNAGSDSNHPRQMKLATQDGKLIDQETGEILDE